MCLIKSDLMRYKTIVLGSHNTGKIREMRSVLSSLFDDFKFPSASDLGLSDPPETGDTFKENAQLKSRFYVNLCNLPVLSDDSGLVIPFLEGFPGLFSARIAKKNGVYDFPYAFSIIEQKLKDRGIDPLDPSTKSQRGAFFVCGLSLTLPNKTEHYIEEECHGHLTFPARGSRRTGYDPLFIKDGFNITFAEMTTDEKNQHSQRGKAFQRFKNQMDQ